MKIFKTALITLAALALSTSVFAQDPTNEVKKKFNEAVPLLQAKKYAEALPILEKTVEMGLEIPDALDIVEKAQKQISNCYFRMGLNKANAKQFEEAVVLLTKADQLGQLYNDNATSRNAKRAISQVYTSLGGNAFNNKDYATAAEIFAKGYAANPQDTALAMNLAMSYCELKDYQNGVKVYTDIIALGDKHSKFAEVAAQAKTALSDYLIQKALDEIKAGNNEAAYATLDQIIAANPQNSTAHMLRIQTATNSKEWDNVIAWGEAAALAQTDPALQSDAYFLLGAAYDSKDNNADAISTYAKVTEGNNAAAAKTRIAELKALNK